MAHSRYKQSRHFWAITHSAFVLTSGLPFRVMAYWWICCVIVEIGVIVNNEIALQWWKGNGVDGIHWNC